MKYGKTIISVIAATFVALVYVHQQIELVKLSYSIEKKEKRLKEIVDRREYLRYTIAHLEDPSRLEQVLLAQKIDCALPKQGQIVRMAKAQRSTRLASRRYVGVERKPYFGIMEFLSPRAEAHVRER